MNNLYNSIKYAAAPATAKKTLKQWFKDKKTSVKKHVVDHKGIYGGIGATGLAGGGYALGRKQSANKEASYYEIGHALLEKDAMPKFLTNLGAKIKGNKYVDAFSPRKSSTWKANDYGMTESTNAAARKALRNKAYKTTAGVAGVGAGLTGAYALGKGKSNKDQPVNINNFSN